MIRNRAAFDSVLASTIDDLIAREKEEPAYPVWGLLRRRLEAMRDATREGRIPPREERDRCLPGTIAMRELEPAYELDLYNLCQRLHELQYYYQVRLTVPFRTWLSRLWKKP